MKMPSLKRSWYTSDTAVVYGSTPVWPAYVRAKRDPAALAIVTLTRGCRIP